MTHLLWATVALQVGSVTLDPGGLFGWIVVGLLAGWLAGHLTRGRGFGCLGDILLGIVGGLIGGYVLSAFFHQSGALGFGETLLTAFVGAFVLAIIGRLLFGDGGRARHVEWGGQRRRLNDQ
ncbi:MAG TPA: GlsB/YeaQ/YmgE family stress response membrane protein [Ktedonobacterales bacterium]|nr:GlsB/YeaQ/YmgE family stress response membrane protein [Ktedonobacterales bacterium]